VYDLNFLPGAVKYGDLPGLLALAAPLELWLADQDKERLSLVRSAYKAAGQAGRLTEFTGDRKDVERAALAWLRKR
jgi:hypothetical protein